MPGYIYLATNPFLRSDIFKIGKTLHDVDQRMLGLRNTSIPGRYTALKEWYVSDVAAAEKKVHSAFAYARVDPDREFFSLDFASAFPVIDALLVEFLEDVPTQRHRIPRPRPEPYASSKDVPRPTISSNLCADISEEQVLLDVLPDAFVLEDLMSAANLSRGEAERQIAYWGVKRKVLPASYFDDRATSRVLFKQDEQEGYSLRQALSGLSKIVRGTKMMVGPMALQLGGWGRHFGGHRVEVVVEELAPSEHTLLPGIILTVRSYDWLQELEKNSTYSERFAINRVMPEAAIVDMLHGAPKAMGYVDFKLQLPRMHDKKVASDAVRRALKVAKALGVPEAHARNSLSSIPQFYDAATGRTRKSRVQTEAA